MNIKTHRRRRLRLVGRQAVKTVEAHDFDCVLESGGVIPFRLTSDIKMWWHDNDHLRRVRALSRCAGPSSDPSHTGRNEREKALAGGPGKG